MDLTDLKNLVKPEGFTYKLIKKNNDDFIYDIT